MTSSGRHRDLAAETAADVGCDDPHLVLGDAEGEREHRAQDVRHLRRGVHDDALADRLHDGRPRLHERRDETLLQEPAGDGDLGVGQCGLDRGAGAGGAGLESPGIGAIRGRVGVDQVRALGQGGLHVHDRGQRFVFDVDALQRVLGADLVTGGDHGDGFADVVDLGDGQAGCARVDHVWRDRPRAGQVALGVGEVLTGVDGNDARPLPGLGGIDRDDPGVGHRAAQDGQVQHPGQGHVVGPGGATGDQMLVFLAPAGPADFYRRGVLDGGHEFTPADAAACTAFTMFW